MNGRTFRIVYGFGNRSMTSILHSTWPLCWFE